MYGGMSNVLGISYHAWLWYGCELGLSVAPYTFYEEEGAAPTTGLIDAYWEQAMEQSTVSAACKAEEETHGRVPEHWHEQFLMW